MLKLQGVSVLMSANVKEWQHKDIMDQIDNQVWDCMTDEWAEYSTVKETAHPCENPISPKSHVGCGTGEGLRCPVLTWYEIKDLKYQTGWETKNRLS